MRLISTLSVLALVLVLSSCSKTPAPSTSFVSTKYLGIDHLYTCKGLEQDGTMYVINGDESGSTNKLKMMLTNVTKSTYPLGATADNAMTFYIGHDTYSSHPRNASGSIIINRVDTTLSNIHATFTSRLINEADSSDYLEVSGEFNVKYQY